LTRHALLAAACLLAGCAATPYRTSASWSARKPEIRRVAVLPPLVTLYEEQARQLMPFLVKSDEWSATACENLRGAFEEELAAEGATVSRIQGEEKELDDLADLFSVVDLSIRRHVYGESQEEFAERSRAVDYSLGSCAEWMERQQIDAFWILGGSNLVPTSGARARDAFDNAMVLLAALGRAPTMSTVLQKLDLRAALVARDGSILFFTRIRNADVHGEEPGTPAVGDLRDPGYAQRVVREILAESGAGGRR
jgi:hypothetical protein